MLSDVMYRLEDYLALERICNYLIGRGVLDNESTGGMAGIYALHNLKEKELQEIYNELWEESQKIKKVSHL